MSFFLFFIAIAGYFSACSKASDVPRPGSRQEIAGVVFGIQKNNNFGGSTCNCQTGQNSCVANCYFSDCCVCWNSALETGACGCYFGIAKCNTGPIGKDNRVASSNDIKFFPARFRQYMNFLKGREISILPLEESLSALLNARKSVNGYSTDHMIVVSGSAYQLFSDRYRQFMEGLSAQQQQWVVEYIQANYTIN